VKQPDNRPALLIDGCHHSNEVLGAEISLAAIHELVEQYGTDPDITRWVDMFRIFVVPVVNVDGHDVVTSGRDPRWRKNTRNTDGNVALSYPEGVDIKLRLQLGTRREWRGKQRQVPRYLSVL
jgi:murein tripeptide amidase MpaA